MDRNAAPPGESEESHLGGMQAYQRLKPNSAGLVAVVFMAIATAAPITAMPDNVPVAVGFGNGTGAPAGYLVATAVLTLFSVGYIAMSRYITAAGAFYGYISHGLGQVVGMASGLLACLSYIVFEASLIGIFSSFGQSTFEAQLGLDIPWQVFAILMLILNATLAYFDINLTAKVLGVLLITEMSVLTIMAFSVLFSGGGPDGIPLSARRPELRGGRVRGALAEVALPRRFNPARGTGPIHGYLQRRRERAFHPLPGRALGDGGALRGSQTGPVAQERLRCGRIQRRSPG